MWCIFKELLEGDNESRHLMCVFPGAICGAGSIFWTHNHESTSGGVNGDLTSPQICV